MKMLSFSHVRMALLFFVIFFGITAFAQFLFVRIQSDMLISKDFVTGAQDINRAIAYDNGVSAEEYNNAVKDSPNYYVVFNDGVIFDYTPDVKVGVPEGLIPPVECPVLTDMVLRAPSIVPFPGHTKEPERWTLP